MEQWQLSFGDCAPGRTLFHNRHPGTTTRLGVVRGTRPYVLALQFFLRRPVRAYLTLNPFLKRRIEAMKDPVTKCASERRNQMSTDGPCLFHERGTPTGFLSRDGGFFFQPVVVPGCLEPSGWSNSKGYRTCLPAIRRLLRPRGSKSRFSGNWPIDFRSCLCSKGRSFVRAGACRINRSRPENVSKPEKLAPVLPGPPRRNGGKTGPARPSRTLIIP